MTAERHDHEGGAAGRAVRAAPLRHRVVGRRLPTAPLRRATADPSGFGRVLHVETLVSVPGLGTGAEQEHEREHRHATQQRAAQQRTADKERTADGLTPEAVAICELCREPTAVAEIAALLGLPLGAVRVLLTDLVNSGHVRLSETPPSTEGPSPRLIERVLNGLARARRAER